MVTDAPFTIIITTTTKNNNNLFVGYVMKSETRPLYNCIYKNSKYVDSPYR